MPLRVFAYTAPVVAALLGVPTLAHAGQASYAAQCEQGEDANIAIVKGFLTDFRQAMASGKAAQVRMVAERYMAEDYIQHSDSYAPGREGFIADTVSRLAPIDTPVPTSPAGADGGGMRMPRDLHFLSDGDVVVWVSEGFEPGKLVFNMVRIEDGKMKEHWASM